MPPAKISKDGTKLTNKSSKSGKIKKKNDIFQTIRKQNIQFLKNLDRIQKDTENLEEKLEEQNQEIQMLKEELKQRDKQIGNLETENIRTKEKLKKVKEELNENEAAMNCVICWESKVCYFLKHLILIFKIYHLIS